MGMGNTAETLIGKAMDRARDEARKVANNETEVDEEGIVQWHQAMIEAVKTLKESGNDATREHLRNTGEDHAYWAGKAGDAARRALCETNEPYGLAKQTTQKDTPEWETKIPYLWTWRYGLEGFLRDERERAQVRTCARDTMHAQYGEDANAETVYVERETQMKQLRYTVKVTTKDNTQTMDTRAKTKKALIKQLKSEEIGPPRDRTAAWTDDRLLLVWKKETKGRE